MTPIMALTGANETLKREYLKKILAKIPPDEVTTYFADETPAPVIFAQCSQDSLFGANNVVLVKNIDALSGNAEKEFEEALENYLKHINSNALLILLAESLGAALTRAVGEVGEVFEYKKMYRNELVDFVEKKLSGEGIRFEEDVPDFIVTMVNEDSTEAEMALEMIFNLAKNTHEIRLEQAKMLLSRSATSTVFDLIEGIFTRSARKALQALADLKLTGEPVTRLNYMILRTARLLWGYLGLANKSDASSILKIKPYEAKRLAEYSRSVDLKFVSAVIELVRRVEFKSKSMAEEFAFLEIENFILTAPPGANANIRRGR